MSNPENPAEEVSSAPEAAAGETVEIVETVDTAAVDAAVTRASVDPSAAVETTALSHEVVHESGESNAPVATAAPVLGTNSPAPDSAQLVYVQAPIPPKMKGNRVFAIGVGALSTLLFAILYAVVGYFYLSLTGNSEAVVLFLSSGLFIGTTLTFFAGFVILSVILNKAAWWTWAVFGLLLGVLVYFGSVGSSVLSQAAVLTPDQVSGFVAQRWLEVYAIAAFVIAREIPVWMGGWIARNGRKVSERNQAAQDEYEQLLAAGPVLS